MSGIKLSNFGLLSNFRVGVLVGLQGEEEVVPRLPLDLDIWTLRSINNTNTWTSVWANTLSKFVAVTSGGTQRVMISEDGIDWTLSTAFTGLQLSSVCWSPELGKYVAVASGGSGVIVIQYLGTILLNPFNVSYITITFIQIHFSHLDTS